jgi:chromate transporter
MDGERRVALGQLARLFLRLGATAFGGPAAHLAMMRAEVVTRRAWLTEDEFLDLLGATSLLPGPSSTEMAIFIGRARAGWPGVVVAGACFILPAAFIVTGLAWAYTRYGTLSQIAGLLYGVKPVVIALVVQALWGLRRAALKSRLVIGVGVAALVAALLGVNVIVVLLGAGLVTAGTTWAARTWSSRRPPKLLAVDPVGLTALFLVFLKIGAVLFGSGYVLLAFLRADLVQHYGWLNEGHLLDAIAVGQVTPGPVFTTATFIGYLLAGPAGAAVATLGIFLPSFVYVVASAPLLPRIRRSLLASAFLDGVNVAALALMATIAWQLGRTALVDVPTGLIALAGGVLLLTLRPNPTWLLLGAGALGLVIGLLR